MNFEKKQGSRALEDMDMINFIDSMQEEPTIPDIVDEHWWEMLGEEPVSEDLEEAAKMYAKKESHGYEPCNIVETFKAGANWQKQKDAEALNENALLYNARLEGVEIGKAEMKQQMMKEAIEAEYWDCSLMLDAGMRDIFKDGDEVKLIIIKED